MNIILGIMSLIILIIGSVAITFLTGFEILHLSLLFIIPAGGIIIGYLCGFGYYKGLVISNKYITIKHLFIGFIISLLCIIGIKYTTYFFTCVDSEINKIVYSYEGDHISNYEANGYGKLDFLTYNKYMIETTPISFAIKNIPIGEISNSTVGWISTMIDFLGVIIGCIAAGLAQKEKPYCHNCKLYKKKKKLFLVPKEEKTDFFNRLDQFISEGNWEATYSMLNKYGFDKTTKKKEHFLCKLIYCENCETAALSFELYELTYQKRVKKNIYYEYSVHINNNIARKFLNKEPSSLNMNTKTDKNITLNETVKVNDNIKVNESVKVDDNIKVDESVKVDDNIKVDESVKVDDNIKVDESVKVDDNIKVDESVKVDDNNKVDESVKVNNNIKLDR